MNPFVWCELVRSENFEDILQECSLHEFTLEGRTRVFASLSITKLFTFYTGEKIVRFIIKIDRTFPYELDFTDSQASNGRLAIKYSSDRLAELPI